MDRMCVCACATFGIFRSEAFEYLLLLLQNGKKCDFPLNSSIWSGLLCFCLFKHTYNIVIFVLFFCLWVFFHFIDKPDKKNFVDSNDISIYKTKRTITTSLFTPDTRPDHINRLYETAAATPVVPICSDDIDGNDRRSTNTLFGATRRRITKKIDADIETRIVSVHCCLYMCFFVWFVRACE